MRHPLHLFSYCPKCGSNDFNENDFKSKRCGNCGFVYYFNPLAATVGIITNERDEVLVARRARGHLTCRVVSATATRLPRRG